MEPTLTISNSDKPRLLVVGYARHGKDTACEYLQDWGLKFVSSSYYCAEKGIMAAFPGRWASVDECFADRVNHRKLWYDLIAATNMPDGSYLARSIYEDGYDIYCGMRNKRELFACRNTGLIDAVVWVDASDRLPPESKDSCTIEPWMADYIIDNNGDLDNLQFNIDQLMEHLTSA